MVYNLLKETSKSIVMHYISYNKTISKGYYDRRFVGLEQLSLDMKKLHAGREYNVIPIYLNNINNCLERLACIGNLVFLDNVISNIKKIHLVS